MAAGMSLEAPLPPEKGVGVRSDEAKVAKTKACMYVRTYASS